jgi:inner membrane transporter RhtA
MRPGVFSILMSLEPAAAALAGMVLLAEFLSPLQWLAVVAVTAASVGATRSSNTISEPMPN